MSHDRDADRSAIDQAAAELDAAFAALRAVPPAPSADLIVRVLADADRVVARPRARDRAAPRGLAGLWAALGGWTGGAGLATATLAGLAIGFGAPDVMSGVTGAGISDDAAFAAWLWPDVGRVMDGLTAAEEG